MIKRLLTAGLRATLAFVCANAQERGLGVSSRPESVNLQQRFALIIGNSAYKDAPLQNPANDARDIAQRSYLSRHFLSCLYGKET